MYACAILYVTVWFFSSSLFCRKCVCCFCFCEYNRSSHHTCRESETACECELVWVCVCVCMLKRRLCRVAKFIPFHSKRELSIFYFFFAFSTSADAAAAAVATNGADCTNIRADNLYVTSKSTIFQRTFQFWANKRWKALCRWTNYCLWLCAKRWFVIQLIRIFSTKSFFRENLNLKCVRQTFYIYLIKFHEIIRQVVCWWVHLLSFYTDFVVNNHWSL